MIKSVCYNIIIYFDYGGVGVTILEQISEKLQKGRGRELEALIKQALEEGVGAEEILNGGLIFGMSIVGEKFKSGELYLPEVMMAARAMDSGVKILKPALTAVGVEPIGRAVICTVKGDKHDIGKNLVKMMIEGAGISCEDLGVDVPAEKIVEAVKRTNAKIVCLSSLLTTTMPEMKNVISALEEAGIRKDVKVMVGGAPLSQKFADEIGADSYTPDAASCAEAAKGFFI